MNYQDSIEWAAALAARTTEAEYRSQGGWSVMAYDLARRAAIDRGLVPAPPTPTKEEVLAAWNEYVRLACEHIDSIRDFVRRATKTKRTTELKLKPR